MQHAEFAVNGTGIPDVPFDIGESYAGLLPISGNANETRELFFWYAALISLHTCLSLMCRGLGFSHPPIPKPPTRSLSGSMAVLAAPP